MNIQEFKEKVNNEISEKLKNPTQNYIVSCDPASGVETSNLKVYTRDQHGVIRDERGLIVEGVSQPATENGFHYHDDTYVEQRDEFYKNYYQWTKNKDIMAVEAVERFKKVILEHPEPRNSLHEAWGFIREEMIELEAELMKKNPRYSQISDEAYDVMITCARLIAFAQDRLHRDNELPPLPDGEAWPEDPTSIF